MKTTPSLKTKPEPPKTPGGISKSLLTPCRRVGLSRNFRKNVASPFNSPITSTDTKQDVAETRKRKDSLEETPKISENVGTENTGTPSRKVELPRRKKSKMLLNSITKPPEGECSQPEPVIAEERDQNVPDDVKTDKTEENVISTPVRLKSSSKEKPIVIIENIDSAASKLVSTPVRLKSKSKSKKISSKTTTKVDKIDMDSKVEDEIKIEKENLESNKQIETQSNEIKINTKGKTETNLSKDKNEISPNKLTKECIVVIQKKIFKNQLNEKKKLEVDNESKQTSQALFNDSDSDDAPLICLNKTEKAEIVTVDDDDDFTSKPKLKKTNSSKPNNNKPEKPNSSKESTKTKIQLHNPSQNSLDDDDDFFEKKKTILIRKSYDKVIKPSKAKSTGSITQKDIEDLKARIETKKKMLLAQSLTDTKELRELIKKWQKGCQDALMELMNLMKNKCPEQNMQYSQMLQTLKIPANLVGYDSDNDCFVTPEDENIILSHIKE